LSKPLWIDIKLGQFLFHVLNLDHPDVEAVILSEMNSGVDVYYDRRWEVTEVFCRFLISDPAWVTNRSVLVIGAGVGLETLVIGRFCKKMILNDLAPVALNLCARQLRKNRIFHFELMPGRFETLDYPIVDIVIGCFLVYNADTALTMTHFLARCAHPVLLMNEGVPRFRKLVKKYPRETRCLFEKNGFVCILFGGDE